MKEVKHGGLLVVLCYLVLSFIAVAVLVTLVMRW